MLRDPCKVGPKSRYDATADPSVNDDAASGWGVGSTWLRADTSELFVCYDNTVGAALWEEVLTGSGGVHVSAVDPTINDDVVAGYDQGSMWLNTVLQTLWCCLDASTGAAVWRNYNNLANLYPYVVGPIGLASYQTIQSAINQAVADGAGSSNIKIIHILPGTYVENLSFAPYVYLRAANFSGVPGSFALATIRGNHAFNYDSASAGVFTLQFEGLSFEATSGVCLTYAGTAKKGLYLSNCTIGALGADPAILFGGTGTTNQLVLRNQSSIGVGDVASRFWTVTTATGIRVSLSGKSSMRHTGRFMTAGEAVNLTPAQTLLIEEGDVLGGITISAAAKVMFRQVAFSNPLIGTQGDHITVSSAVAADSFFERCTGGAGDTSGEVRIGGAQANSLTETPSAGAGSIRRFVDEGTTTKRWVNVKNNYVATVAPAVTDDSSQGYAIGSDWYDAVLDIWWKCKSAAVGAAVWVRAAVASVDQLQVLYVGKHGSNGADGKTPDKAKLTIGAAITAAGTPASEAAAVTVKVLDDGEYAESITLPSYVNLYAPDATINGKLIINDGTLVRARRLINSSAGNVEKQAGTGTAYVDADYVENTTGSGMVTSMAGRLYFSARRTSHTTGGGVVAFGFSGSVDIIVNIGEMRCAGSAAVQALSGSTAPCTVVGKIGRIYESAASTGISVVGQAAKVTLSVDRIECTTAYNIASHATNIFEMLVGYLSGTETIGAAASVRVTRARRDNFAATSNPTVNDDGAHGYAVGGMWINKSQYRLFMCEAATTGAANWIRVTGAQSWKESVVAASTADVSIASAPATVDGVTLTVGDRIALKNQTVAAENGIYVFAGAGAAMTRSTDTNTDVELNGAITAVLGGTINARRIYQQVTLSPISGTPVWSSLRPVSEAGVPGVDHDSAHGHFVGDQWWDNAGRNLYVQRDQTVGAAAWDRMLNATTGGTIAGDVTLDGNLTLADTTASTLGVIMKGVTSFCHNFHHPIGGGAVPAGLNTFIGVSAGNFTTGSTAVAVYHGSYLTGVGYSSLAVNTIGYSNTGLGAGTLQFNTEGYRNVAVGTNALNKMNTGYQNVAVGSYASSQDTTGHWNTVVGDGALQWAVGTTGNTAIGFSTLGAFSASGSDNTAVGMSALLSASTAHDNVAVGRSALYNVSTGYEITAIGRNAGRYLTDGASSNATSYQAVYVGADTKASADGTLDEIVIGFGAVGQGSHTAVFGHTTITATYLRGTVNLANAVLTSNLTLADTTASTLGVIMKGTIPFIHNYHDPVGGPAVPLGQNLFVGEDAGNFLIGSYGGVVINLFASRNTGIGYQALTTLHDGHQNTAVGALALSACTDGATNTAVGAGALSCLTTAASNTAVGSNAMVFCTTGDENTAVGLAALRSVTAGFYNTAVGESAGTNFETGDNNTHIGWEAGMRVVAGTDNTASIKACFLGANTRASAAGATNEVVIGYGAQGAGSNTVTIGDANIAHTYLKGTIHGTNVSLADSRASESGFDQIYSVANWSFTATAGRGVAGISLVPAWSGVLNGNTVDLYAGYFGPEVYASISSCYGLYVYAYVEAGTVAEAYGLSVALEKAAAATVTTWYGIYVEPMADGNPGTGWALYNASGFGMQLTTAAEAVYFRNSSIGIASLDVSHLDLTSDGSIDLNGHVFLADAVSKNTVVGNQAALATTATDGFLYIPTCAGVPTGVPTAYTGKVALVLDTTNNTLYVYDGEWLGVELTA